MKYTFKPNKNNPKTIGIPDQKEWEYFYGPNHERRYVNMKDFSLSPQQWQQRVYTSNAEYLFKGPDLKSQTIYIQGGDGLAAIVNYNADGDDLTMAYATHLDYLGSLEILSKEDGSLFYEQSFDAWGKFRNPDTWQFDPNYQANQPNWLWRGYTGHEMLYEFDLIHMNGRLYDPFVGRMLSPDNFVQDATSTQNYNRYSYVVNNPLKYTDPSGELVWFVPVIAGAVIGGYMGGAIQQGSGGLSGANWNPWGGNGGKWDNTAWRGVTVGAIAGAGVGLGVSAGLAAAGANITGISAAGSVGFASTGATTTAWNITANALITANINMASSGLQGGSWGETARTGLVGLGAGAIGGGIASKYSTASSRGAMSLKGIKTQNYVTNILNGAGDRFVKGLDDDLSTQDLISNTLAGGFEGYFSTKMLSSSKFMNIGRGANNFNNPVVGRYLTSFLTNSVTSTPGASLMAAKIYGSIYPTWKLGMMNEDLSISITTSMTFSPWIYLGLNAIQKEILPNYPYGYGFFRP